MAQGDGVTPAGASPPGPRVLACAERITVRVRDRHILPETSWQLREGEQWAVLGPNGSGKSSLVRALAGLTPTSAGSVRIDIPGGRGAIGYVSFELQEALLRREDDLRLTGPAARDPDTGLRPREMLFDGGDHAEAGRLAAFFGIEGLLDRPVRVLSTGEMRRALIAQALTRLPRLLILDEPFDGLDSASRSALRERLRSLARSGLPMVLVSHRTDEILPEITHVALLKDGRVESLGPRADVLTEEALRRLYAGPGRRTADAWSPPGPARDVPPGTAAPRVEPLIEMRGVTVRYGDTIVLEGLDWTVRSRENWGIVGPNGCGKTTLLSLVYGDNPQAYSNDIRLFGRKRGSGESLWEIRRRIGIVSAALQIGYRRQISVSEVVASGHFDSVGLYRRPSDAQSTAAGAWIDRLGLSRLADRSFEQMSYGERRMTLIARAMVKSPELLILDEPCEGLDPANRKAVLALVDRIGFESETGILYVSHLEDELPRCLSHTLRLRAPRT